MGGAMSVKPLSARDADAADACIEHLIHQFGVATDADLLDMARDTYHPLHRVFDWSDESVPGEMKRLDHAFVILCRLNDELKKVTTTKGTINV
jgi:hypothetical protein